MKNYNTTIKRGNNAKNSMYIILTHLENDLPYSDSLKFHFANITDTWIAEINRSVFESLKSEGLSIISNKDLRLEIVNLYNGLGIGQKEHSDRFRDLMDEASTNILSTRFIELWSGNYKDLGSRNNYADI
jgi:hypothetical protein